MEPTQPQMYLHPCWNSVPQNKDKMRNLNLMPKVKGTAINALTTISTNLAYMYIMLFPMINRHWVYTPQLVQL